MMPVLALNDDVDDIVESSPVGFWNLNTTAKESGKRNQNLVQLS
jgi:hypothetical protein